MLRQPITPFGLRRPRPTAGLSSVSGRTTAAKSSSRLVPPSRRGLTACNALGDNRGQQPSLASNVGGGGAALPFDLDVGPSTSTDGAPATDATPTGSASPTSLLPDSPICWDSWLRVFQTMDQAAEESEHLSILLQDAVRQEDYAAAARLKAALSGVQAQDTVAAVQAELSAALQEEQYGDAVVIRDEGMAWMQGWWAGRADGDAVGHIMHITPEFGRYTGRVYTAVDLWEAAGLSEQSIGGGAGGLAALRAALATDSSSTRAAPPPVAGTPALEVFVVRDGQGRLVNQAVSLLGPTPSQNASTAQTSSGGGKGGVTNVEGVANALASEIGPAMRLSVLIGQDGSTTIRAAPLPSATASDASKRASAPSPSPLTDGGVSGSANGDCGIDSDVASGSTKSELPVPPLAPPPVRSKFTAWEAEEAAETLRALADLPPTGSSSSAAAAAEDIRSAIDSNTPTSSDSGGGGGVDLPASLYLPYEGGQVEEGFGVERDAEEELMAAALAAQAARRRIRSSSQQPHLQRQQQQALTSPPTSDESEQDAEEDYEAEEAAFVAELTAERKRLQQQQAVGTEVDRDETSAGKTDSSELQAACGQQQEAEEEEGEVADQVQVDAVLQAPELPDEDLRVVASSQLLLQSEEQEAQVLSDVAPSTASPAPRDDNEEEWGKLLSELQGPAAGGSTVVSEQPQVSEDNDDDGGDEEDGSMFAELHRSPAVVDRASVDEFTLQLGSGGGDIPAGDASIAAVAADGAADDVDGVPPIARVDVVVPMDARVLGSARMEQVLALVVQRVMQAQESHDPALRPDGAALRLALRELVRSLIRGAPTDILIPAAAAAPAAAASAAAATRGGSAAGSRASASTTAAAPIRYSRLASAAGAMEGVSRTDPFEGLYMGSFGVHGPELLRLRRVVLEGEEMVQAVKVTGDANVPAGAVSFRAKIARKHRLSASGVYPDELGVTARYRGQGRVAAAGYTQPKWVEGELLLFNASSSYTSGAQLGFVWHVPGERKFLILLSKVDLAECGKRAASGSSSGAFN